MARFSGTIARAANFVADPASLVRENGRQIDWGNVPESYRLGSHTVRVNGAVAAGRNKIQLITVSATGGTFTVTIGGQTTSALAYNISLATMESTLEALSSVGAGNIRVFGTAGSLYYLEYINALGFANGLTATTNAGSLTGGGGTAAVTTPAAGAASPTSITVDALLGDIPNGAVLDFGYGPAVTLTAAAVTGATTLSVTGVSINIADNATALYGGTGPKKIAAGTVLGIDGSTGDRKVFPRVASTNPAYGILETDAVQSDGSDASTGYSLLRGGVLYENRLPDAIANGGSLPSAFKTELVSSKSYFQFIATAENNAA